MTSSKTHSRKGADKKKGSAPPAAPKHHLDGAHTGEIDIDLNRTYPNFELQILLAVLKPLLRRAIEIARTCPASEQAGFVAGYHNITVCDGAQH